MSVWIYKFFQIIPAVVLSVLIFVFFLTHRTVFKSLENQALGLLFIIKFILLIGDLPMVLSFFYPGYVYPATAAYCTWWTFFEYSFNLCSELIMITISIQRHTLIFHRNKFNIRYKRYLLYYFPFLFSLIYPITFYLFAILVYPRDDTQ